MTGDYKVDTVTFLSVIHDNIFATFGCVTFRKQRRFLIDRDTATLRHNDQDIRQSYNGMGSFRRLDCFVHGTLP